MDVLTQGLLGGVMAQGAARASEKRLATLAGIGAGLLADVDIFIRSAQDPLLNIEFHRHFTHSLLFIPFGAAIAFVLLWPFLRRRLDNVRLYLFCLLGYSLSGLLDAFTSYGTHLLWPVYDERIAFNIISVVDPVFTLILLVTLLLGLRLKRRSVAFAGLAVCGVYLSLGFVQLQRAEQVAQHLAEQRGHEPQQHIVKPTLANLLLWRSVYKHDGRIYVDAIRPGLTGQARIFAGESVEQFNVAQDLPGLDPASVLYQDIERFRRFSDNFIARHPQRRDVIGDVRYSMLPNSVQPLWGIVIDSQRPSMHADYQFFRENNERVRNTFWNMLLGRCGKAECQPSGGN